MGAFKKSHRSEPACVACAWWRHRCSVRADTASRQRRLPTDTSLAALGAGVYRGGCRRRDGGLVCGGGAFSPSARVANPPLGHHTEEQGPHRRELGQLCSGKFSDARKHRRETEGTRHGEGACRMAGWSSKQRASRRSRRHPDPGHSQRTGRRGRPRPLRAHPDAGAAQAECIAHKRHGFWRS
jgi:hypothetical protein